MKNCAIIMMKKAVVKVLACVFTCMYKTYVQFEKNIS